MICSLAALWATPAAADGLTVALVTHELGQCQSAPDDVLPTVRALLAERGHTASIVPEENVASEIEAFDVVVLGAGWFDCGWSWDALDSVIADYVQQGGGLLATGWVAYYLADNPAGREYPGLEGVLPVVAGTGYTEGHSIAAISGHPITEGVAHFTTAYNSYGAGVAENATPLVRDGDIFSGAAWQLGDGRAVYLGPIYLANWNGYENRPLLDGSSSDAQRLFLQAVEWVGGD